jgi:hypothetical protein
MDTALAFSLIISLMPVVIASLAKFFQFMGRSLKVSVVYRQEKRFAILLY